MPQFDKRNTIEHLHTGGSDIGLQVDLTEAIAQKYYGASAVAGWFTIGTFEGGTIEYTPDIEEDKDEAGQLTGKTITRSKDFFLRNQIKETSDAVEDLIDEELSVNFHKYRYALPVGTQLVSDGAGGTVSATAHKLYGVERGKIQPGFSIPTGEGEKRLREIVLQSTEYQGTPAYVRGTVDLAAEANWPDKFDPFLTA
ncbi:MAG: hypothetical protein AAF170_07660 [Bacteroidota bacterium]